MPRSASTYVWQIAYEFIQPRYHQYYIKDSFPEHLRDDFNYHVYKVIPELLELLPEDYVYLIKTHGDYHPALARYEAQGLIKVICSYRNPYDVVQSWEDIVAKEKKKPLEERRSGFAEVESYYDILNYVVRDIKICSKWITNLANPLIYQYETTKISHRDNIIKMADFLEFKDYDIEGMMRYFDDKSNILEYNKGKVGRGKNFDNDSYPKYAELFDSFLSQFF